MRAPALSAPRGEPRVRQLFEKWLDWTHTNPYAGGCPFVQFSFELDDQPGELREHLLRHQEGWLKILADAARRTVSEGQFRPDLDPDQFAYDFQGLMLGYHHAARLMRDPQAELRVRRSFENLLRNAKS